jgi:hypothetical protein
MFAAGYVVYGACKYDDLENVIGGEWLGDCGGGWKGSKLKVLIGSIAISLETER